MAYLEVRGVGRSFGTVRAVDDVDLAVQRGEFVSLLGPSGSGKTTLLRIVAGLERADRGSIWLDGGEITHLPPQRRQMGMVFQSYALFPNLTAAQNVAFGLRIRRMPKRAVEERVDELLRLVGLAEKAGRYPHQLSGGEQQRVALARALAPSPRVLLLDEPLSALDARIRLSLRNEIRRIQRTLQITTLYVTHDQEEALAMSDRVVVFNQGRIEQVGTPEDVYDRPKSTFVAEFVGTSNRLAGEVRSSDPPIVLLDGQEIALRSLPPDARPGDRVELRLRPERIALTPRGDGFVNRLKGLVEDVMFLGARVIVRVRVSEQVLWVEVGRSHAYVGPEAGREVELFLPDELLVTVTEKAEAARPSLPV